MTSGYRMTGHWFEENKSHGFPEVDPVITRWRFLDVEGPMKRADEGWERQHDELIRLLQVSNCLAFKAWKLKPVLKYLGFGILGLLAILIVVAAFWGPEMKIVTLRSLIVMALSATAVYVVGENVVRVVGFRDTLHRILLGIGMCCGGFAVARLHLHFFDRLYLALGKVNRIVKQ